MCRSLKLAIDKYSDAVQAARSDPDSETAALNNRAAAHLKLGNYGHALNDALRATELTPNNVKAHFRAAVSATNLEKLNIASRAVQAGLRSCKDGNGTAGDITLLNRQLTLIAETKKRVAEREKLKKERESQVESVNNMLKRRSIRIGRTEYAQQRDYERTRPHLVEDEWCWPVLLVYQSPAHGEQSDFLASVGEGVKMTELVELMFGEEAKTPWWDVDHAYGALKELRILVRKEARQEDENDSDGDGWKVENEVEWVELKGTEDIGELVCRKDYVIPLYPVVHIIPKGLAKRLINGLA